MRFTSKEREGELHPIFVVKKEINIRFYDLAVKICKNPAELYSYSLSYV